MEKKCHSCGATDNVLVDFTTHLEIKTAEGVMLFSVDTKTDECLYCISENIRMMYGEMRATLQEDKPENWEIKPYINVDFLWPDKNKRPIEFKKPDPT